GGVSRMGTVEVEEGVHLRYDESGAGPAVVLIHPGLWDRRVWDEQMESFPAAGFRTIRYDQRGYGESSRLTGDPYSPAEDLRALLDHLDVPQAALVGCSIGDGIAINFTLENPDRVWAFVPVASGHGR